jgi:hypothetical protein
MNRVAGLLLLMVAIVPFASAAVPEIDPGGAVNAVALITGAWLVIRGTRKR